MHPKPINLPPHRFPGRFFQPSSRSIPPPLFGDPGRSSVRRPLHLEPSEGCPESVQAPRHLSVSCSSSTYFLFVVLPHYSSVPYCMGDIIAYSTVSSLPRFRRSGRGGAAPSPPMQPIDSSLKAATGARRPSIGRTSGCTPVPRRKGSFGCCSQPEKNKRSIGRATFSTVPGGVYTAFL
jgi:hypothetical protein